MTVMDEVTTHIAEVFTQAFNTVNEHYERIFGILFPGGEGRLELSDPDDILNSGVDIYARPAGKKSNVSRFFPEGNDRSHPWRC